MLCSLGTLQVLRIYFRSGNVSKGTIVRVFALLDCGYTLLQGIRRKPLSEIDEKTKLNLFKSNLKAATHFGRHLCRNGTQELKCARRFTQLGISWPQSI